MPRDETELRPCPFCGSKAWSSRKYGQLDVGCSNEDCTIYWHRCVHSKKAWNTRRNPVATKLYDRAKAMGLDNDAETQARLDEATGKRICEEESPSRRTPDPRAVELLQLLRDELRAITLADKTTYEHHEPRKCDGALPRIEGGTCWRTPRQLSERAISKIDAFLTAHPAPAQNEGGERG